MPGQSNVSVFCTEVLETSVITVLHNWHACLPHRVGNFMGHAGRWIQLR